MTDMNDTNSDLPGDGRADRRGVSREEWFRERDDAWRAATGDEPSGRRDDDRHAGDREDRPDPLGSVATEARKIFDSLQHRVGREFGKGFVKGGVSGLGQGLGQAFGGGSRAAGDVWSEAVAGHDHDEYICRACPVCRLKAARRDAGGDVTDHLITAGGELLAAFRQAVDAVSRPATPRRPGDTDTRVEHIDLG
ncbi:MAG: hypothetical protein JWQ95_5807 [Sphaerisporangium sp.]|jgi:hypothetical protein|nr:hypothetical protein [Sphaerisporangium sp.]